MKIALAAVAAGVMTLGAAQAVASLTLTVSGTATFKGSMGEDAAIAETEIGIYARPFSATMVFDNDGRYDEHGIVYYTANAEASSLTFDDNGAFGADDIGIGATYIRDYHSDAEAYYLAKDTNRNGLLSNIVLQSPNAIDLNIIGTDLDSLFVESASTIIYGSQTTHGRHDGPGFLEYGAVIFGLSNVTFSISGESPMAANVTAIPEPTSWAMMLVGFGAIGAEMRRRRISVRRA